MTTTFGDHPTDIAPGATALSPAAAITVEQREKLEARLAELESLGVDWDGYGGRPVNRGALIVALSIMERVGRSGLALPDLYPVPDGGVQLRWDAVSVDLELELEPDGSLASFVCDDRRAGQQIDGDLPGHEGRLELAMARLAQAG